MIDIKNAEEKESRFVELVLKYSKYAVETYNREMGMDTLNTIAINDISLTLALIYDEMRGIKNES